jgi:hypothetical protein
VHDRVGQAQLGDVAAQGRPELGLVRAGGAHLDQPEPGPVAAQPGDRAQQRAEVLARVLGADEQHVPLVGEAPVDRPEQVVVQAVVHHDDPVGIEPQLVHQLPAGGLRDRHHHVRGPTPATSARIGAAVAPPGAEISGRSAVRSRRRMRSWAVTA